MRRPAAAPARSDRRPSRWTHHAPRPSRGSSSFRRCCRRRSRSPSASLRRSGPRRSRRSRRAAPTMPGSGLFGSGIGGGSDGQTPGGEHADGCRGRRDDRDAAPDVRAAAGGVQARREHRRQWFGGVAAPRDPRRCRGDGRRGDVGLGVGGEKRGAEGCRVRRVRRRDHGHSQFGGDEFGEQGIAPPPPASSTWWTAPGSTSAERSASRIRSRDVVSGARTRSSSSERTSRTSVSRSGRATG